jgi:UDP-N-acetylmuramate dehydrogenase
MSNTRDVLISELGIGLLENVPLSEHVSLKVGGRAEFYYVAKDIASLTNAVSVSYKNDIPFFVLGGGYNIVPSDSGFDGLVIRNMSNNIVFSPQASTVIVDSGISIAALINMAAGRDLGGLEFLFGVPGTLGGAIYGNAGAFGYEISDFLKSVTLLTEKDGKLVITKHDNNWMNFSYRSSKLKNSKNGFRPVILTATLQLVQRRKDEILRQMQANLNLKKDSQPLTEISAGSFFRNAGVGREMAAGYLLEQVGAKRFSEGGAAFSQKHANFLINKKKATAANIRTLADRAKEAVNERFGVNLKEEIEYMGKWE